MIHVHKPHGCPAALPLADPPRRRSSPRPSKSRASDSSIGARVPRVLVVDDERSVLEVLHDMLSDQGYEVVAVSSPLEALERARTQKFDAAVLDVAMPEMSGALLHDELRAVDPDLADRTVFISGYVSQDDMVRRVASTVRFLEKPFRTQDLTDKLLEVLPGKQRD